MTGIDELRDGVIVLDETGVVTEANRAAADVVGRPGEDLVGLHCRDILDWEGSHTSQSPWPRATVLRGTSAIATQQVRRRGDRARTLTLSGTYRRRPDGTLEGAVLVLHRPMRTVRKAPTGVEIVSTVSHELRSPLTSVKGFTSLMLNRWDRLSDEQKKMMLEQVNHDADRVTRLITELLDISRLETGRLVLRRQMVDLAKLAESVVAKVGLEYPDLDATVEFADSVPAVYADPDKIEQVLTNLVENACKYASTKGLLVRGRRREQTVAVEVSDRGEGIPASDLPKVFTKFFRREVGRPTGSGLGLWISRGLVESHGGELTAESEPGRGSTFRFSLPVLDLDQLQAT